MLAAPARAAGRGGADAARTRASPRGELPAWLDVEAVSRGFLGLMDGLMLQRIEAGDAYRPADLQRRAGAMLEFMLASAGADRPAAREVGRTA